MKTVAKLLLLSLGLAGLAGCGGVGGTITTTPGHATTGKLAILVGTPQFRARLARGTASFEVRVENPQSGQDVVPPTTVPGTQTTVVLDNVPLGPVTVEVDGFSARQVLLSKGTGNVTIVPGANSVTVVSQIAPEFLYVADTFNQRLLEFSIDPTRGVLTPLSTPFVATQGADPNTSVTDQDRLLYTGDQGTNAVEGFTIGSDGQLSAIAGSLSPTGGNDPVFPTLDLTDHFLYVQNVADTPFDTISGFAIDAQGQLASLGSPVSTLGSSGTAGVLRGDPKRNVLYATLNPSRSVASFTVQSSGALSMIGGAPLPLTILPNDVEVSPFADFVYIVDGADALLDTLSQNGAGALTDLGTQAAGTSPNLSVIHPNGTFFYVADFLSGNVLFFKLDPTTGQATQQGTFSTTNGQVRFVVIDPLGQFLYATSDSGRLAVFTIADDGSLTLQQDPALSTSFIGSPVFAVGTLQ